MADDQELKIKLSAIDNLSPTLLKAVEVLERMNKNVEAMVPATHKAGEAAEHLHGGALNLAAGLEIVEVIAEGVHKAFELLEGAIEKSVEEALAAERATNLLVGALVATGQYSEHAAESVDHYAETVHKLTGANIETTKSHVALAIQMGLSVERAQQMEEASRKLSTVMGGDVDHAFQVLRQSLAGHSRALALVLPQIKEFGSGQLQQGVAIDLVNKSLDAQYQLYQGSFAAGLEKAKTGIGEVYKEFGNIIIQSPLVKQGLTAFVDLMGTIAEKVAEAGKWIHEHEKEITQLATAFGKAALLVGGLAGGLGLAAEAGAAFAAVMTFMTGPIGLTLAGIAALTLAFNRWPGLFDQIIGGIKVFASVFVDTLADLAHGAAALAGVFNETLGTAITDQEKKLEALSAHLATAGQAQVHLGSELNIAAANHRNAAEAAKKHGEAEVDAAHEALEAQSKANAVALNTAKVYGEYEIGTLKIRTELNARAQDRAKEYSDFEKYYNDRIALAVSKEDEQAEKIAGYKAKLLGGAKGAGSEGIDADSDAAVKAEINKQTRLQKAYAEELMTKDQFESAMLQSQIRREDAEGEAESSHETMMMTLLGNSEQAMLMRREEARDDAQSISNDLIRQAQMEGATQAELDAIRVESSRASAEKEKDIQEKYLNDDVKRQEKIGNNWTTLHAKIRLEQAKHGQVLGALQAVQASNEFKAVDGALGNLASLRNSHSKVAFEIGKKAAVAQATINTFLSASMAMAQLGPILGGVVAAAAIASGLVNVQQIESQQFSGQADQGMDSVPSNLSGKSFILSAGEAVIQPEANKDLRDFLSNQKQGGNLGGQGKQGAPVVIQLTVNGSANQDDMRKTTELMIAELRRASERGELVLSSKGVY
jgi:hypothetical protein